MKLELLTTTLLSVAAVVSAVAVPTKTESAAAYTATQIRTDQDPVYHLYLQNVGGKPVLGPESSAGLFSVSNTVSLDPATPGGSPLFLNVNTTASTSYKPLFFGTTATTTSWTMSGDTIIASGQQNFLVCPITGSSNWDLFLQTGASEPAGAGCADWITIHLPCLC